LGDAPQVLARIDDDGLCRVTCTDQDPEYLAQTAEAARQAVRDKYAVIQSDIDTAPGVPELTLVVQSL
jgi:hypothetical protein